MRESLSQVVHHLHQKTSFSCLLGYLQILVGLFWFKATHTQLLEGCGRSGCLTHTGFQKSVRVPAACLPKASKQARLVYRKVSFISDISYQWGRWQTSVQRPIPLPPSPAQVTCGARACIDRWKGLHAETTQLSLIVIFQLVISGLTSILLVVLGTVNLQFQGPFIPISLRPVLGIVAAYVLVIKQLTSLPGVLVSMRQLLNMAQNIIYSP